jgi:hypothetical protein
LAFFNESQYFSAPPEISVTVTYPGPHRHPENIDEKLEHRLKEKTVQPVTAIFLFLPNQNPGTGLEAVKSALDRYFPIFRQNTYPFNST